MGKQAAQLHTFDLKEKKLQFITVALLVILLPLLLYLLQKALQIGTFGAPDAELSIVAQGGATQYAAGEQMTVDIVLNSGTNQVEAVEATILYDPAVVTLTGATGLASDNVNCSQVTPLKNNWVTQIEGLSIDSATGGEIGTETGSVTVVCSAVPPIDQWQNGVAIYQPTTANFNAAIASLTFTTLADASNATLAFEFTPADPKNDSSVLLYEGGCCSTTEVLNAVNNYTYTVGTGGVGGPVPTTPPSTPPSTTTTNLSLATQTGATQFSVGQEMAVDVVLNSAANQVEAVEATIFYDPSVLTLKGATGSATDNISCNPATPLQHGWVTKVDGLTIDTATGAEVGTETGSVTVVCSAVPPTNQWVNGVAVYQPTEANFTGPIATLRFTTLADATNATLTYEFTPADPKNDSSVLVYEGGCCSTTEVLEEVYNLTYTVGAGGPVPTTPPTEPTPTPGIGGGLPTPTPTTPAQSGWAVCNGWETGTFDAQRCRERATNYILNQHPVCPHPPDVDASEEEWWEWLTHPEIVDILSGPTRCGLVPAMCRNGEVPGTETPPVEPVEPADPTPTPATPTYTPVPTSVVCDQCGYCLGEEVPAEYGECVQCLYGEAADPNNPQANLNLVPVEGNAWTIAGCVETSVENATGALAQMANAIVAAAGIISSLVGGFMTTISGGDSTKLEQGKKLLVAGISAIVLSIFAGLMMENLGGDLLRIPGIGS